MSLAASIVLGTIFGVAQASGIIALPIDLVIYWQNTNLDQLYPVHWTDSQTPYIYPPVLAQILLPLHVLPFELVEVAWTTLCFVSLWYCVRIWMIPVVILGFVSIWLPPDNVLGSGLEYVLLGNVQIPMAAAIVAGMRHPAWFAVPIVTKLTTGVGLLWYALRGEWRKFATGLIVTGVVVAAFVLLSPGTWLDWIQFTVANYGAPSIPPVVGPPLPVRLVAAVLLVAWGARTNRPWVVAIAGAMANPGLYGVRSFVAVALGAWALSRWADWPNPSRVPAKVVTA